MLNLSDILIQEHNLEKFDDLVAAIRSRVKSGQYRFFRMDVKPPFADTPENWEDVLESVFYEPVR
jgi:hypothetical protein